RNTMLTNSRHPPSPRPRLVASRMNKGARTMLNSRHRLLTIALAVGGLTMLGTGGALAAVDAPGSAPAGNNPVCPAPHSPLASTPACASHQDARPAVAAESGGGVQADPPEGGEAP